MKRITKRKAAWTGSTIVLALLLALAGQGAAAQPQAQQEEPVAVARSGILAPSSTLISYQGTLTDENGDPINATVTMKFALYDASSGGTMKWGTETQTVQVTDGLFNVLLGSVLTINPAIITGDLWLDIKVNNEQLTPRERITSVPYAVEAGTLAVGAQTRGSLQVNGTVFSVAPDNNPHAVSLWRTDEEGRTHKWSLWQMNQPYGMNSFQIYEYRTDSAGVDCGGNPGDGAICASRLTLWQGGDMRIGYPGSSMNLQVIGNTTVDGLLTAGGYLAVNGRGFFAGATYPEGAVNVQDVGVPLTFKESDQSGQGSLWRLVLDGTNARFDSSDNGTDFTAYHTPITMYPNGGVGCGAITENNLQTAEEQAAGGSDRFEEGDVLCWGIDQLEKCGSPNDRLVQAVADKGGRPIVIGAEVIKVLGPVKRGDILVASGVPGYAMVNNDPVSGSVIAQALEDFDGERGIIKAMIRKF